MTSLELSPLPAAGRHDAPAAGRPLDRSALRWRPRDTTAGLSSAGELPHDACEALGRKLAASLFNLVVVGQFKRGKTSFVNALIGEELLPVGVVPLTSIVTLVEHGERFAADVCYEDGRSEPVSRERLADFVTERGNPRNRKHVREMVIAYPSPWLEGGVRLVDTPGIGSVYEHNTDVARRFLPKADAVLLLLSVEQPVSRAELEYLAEIRGYAGRIFVLMNKADLLSEAELAESLDFARHAIGGATSREANGGAPTLLAVSATLALRARVEGSESLARRSGFPAVAETLRHFLRDEKEDVLLGSIARSALRLITHACFERELEQKALTAPLEQLGEKLRRFDTWRATEDERVAITFRAVCRRLAAKLDAAVDDLFRVASDLFEIPYQTIRSETSLTQESDFYYKLWQEPTSLTLLTSSAILALPRLIGHRLVLKRAREAAVAAARAQSGRVRWDLQQRLDQSVLAFRTRMSGDFEAVSAGLERALRAGAAQRRSRSLPAARCPDCFSSAAR
jgi:GTPase SAR1 family protein